MRLLRFLTLLILSAGCEKTQLEFNSQRWNEYQDLEQYPFRERMLKDIMDRKLFIGQNYRLVTDSLGQPELLTNRQDNELWYPLVIEYGRDIDPVYTKHLVLTMDSDSIITKVETREHDHYADH